MKKNTNIPHSKFRNGVERHANRFAISTSRSNTRYSLSETHATPDGHPVKQIGEHTWLIEKAGIVVHRCPRNAELRRLWRSGSVIRKERKTGGRFSYQVNPMPFGCSNPLTQMFNQLLREIRA